MTKVPSTALQPPMWRIALAFLLSPLLAALIPALVMPLYGALPSFIERFARSALIIALFGAFPPALLLGLPVYFIVRRRMRASVVNCMFVGAMIAALPWLLLSLLFTPDFASVNGHVTVEHGSTTFWGWLELLRFVAMIAGFGASGGFFFWWIGVAGSWPRPPRD